MTVRASLDPADPSRIQLETSYHHRDLVKTIAGTRWSNQDRTWKLTTAWTSCLALRETFRDDLEIAPDLADWAWREKLTRVDPAMALREVTDLGADDAPDTPVTREARRLQDELGLYPHQAVGASFMATVERAGVFDETGTGKTAQTITALRVLHRLGHDVFPALVVAPNTVKRTWQREIEQWWPGLEVSLVTGGAAARRKALEKPAHVYVMNWEQLHKHSRLAKYGNQALTRCVSCGGIDERVSVNRCEVHPRELNQLAFKTVIADEVQRALHPSKQTRALWHASAGAQYRFALTGTPIQDTIADLWFVLRFVSPEEYPAKTAFMDRFADTGFNMWGIFTVFGVKAAAESELHAGVDPRTRRMLKKIVLPFLPPIVRETRYVPMLPAQRKAYRQMLKQTLAELEDGSVLAAVNTLSKAARLMQFASSYAEVDTRELEDGRIEEKVRLVGPSNKVESFLDDIDAAHYGKAEWTGGDFSGSSIVVFAQSRQLIDLLSAGLEKYDIPHGMITGTVSTEERQRHIDEFQDGKTKFILVTIDAGGVGLTLTAADTAVFLQRSWSSVAMKQAESRTHRIGSEVHESVTIIDYVSEDTVEDGQVLRLRDKFDRIESVLKDRELLRKLLSGEEIGDEEE